MKISAYIIAYNEADKIRDCINSVLWADEIVVADSHSNDGTTEIAEKLGAKVFHIPFKGYGDLRNQAISNCHGDWIFSLDSDERCTEKVRDEILLLIKNAPLDIYRVPRKNFFMGKWIKHSGWYPDVKVRIFNKRDVRWTGDFVHETLLLPKKLRIKHLPGDLLHYSYKSKADHIARTKKYAGLSAEKMFHAKKAFGPLKPFISGTAKFIKMYVLKLGFLDGRLGLQIAKISARGVHSKYKGLAEIKARDN